MNQDITNNQINKQNIDNGWDQKWDPSLRELVTKCYFDFDKIAQQMNDKFSTSSFTVQNCQQRWSTIHKKRKNKTSTENSDTKKSQLQAEKLRQMAAPPMENPNKKLSLQELTTNLPKQRQTRDFLDTKATEDDKAEDISFTGEKIKPSGFNVLKEKIRISDEEQKRREEEFLKALDSMNFDSNSDNENPFVFKALFQNDTKFDLEKIDINAPEAKERLEDKIDFKRLSRLERDLDKQGTSQQPQYLVPRNEQEKGESKEEKKVDDVNSDEQGKDEAKDEKAIPEDKDIEDAANNAAKDNFEFIFQTNKNFQKLFESSSDVDSVVDNWSKLEQKVHKNREAEYTVKEKDGIEEVLLNDTKPKPSSSQADSQIKPTPVPTKPLTQQYLPNYSNNYFEESVKKQERYAYSQEVKVIPKSKPEEDFDEEEEEEEEVVENQEGDSEDDELEASRQAIKGVPVQPKEKKKKVKTTKNEPQHKGVEIEIDPQYLRTDNKEATSEISTQKTQTQENKPVEEDPTFVSGDLNEQKKSETPQITNLQELKKKKKKIRDGLGNSKVMEKQVLDLLDDMKTAFTYERTIRKPKVVEEQEEIKSNEVLSAEEIAQREEQQRKLDAEAKKLAEMMREVKRKNEEFEKEDEKKQSQARLDYEKKLVEEQVNKRQQFEDKLKNLWTNSYVTSFFDDKISYLSHPNPVPMNIVKYINGDEEAVNSKERMLHRYQAICFPILGDTNIFVGQLVEYFLKYSEFNGNLQAEDSSFYFNFKLIAFGMFAQYPNKKKSLYESIVSKDTVDYLYLVFDTFEGRGSLMLEDVVKRVQLEEIFDPICLRDIQKSSLHKDNCAYLQDIIVFLYKSMEMIEDIFAAEAALTGICLEDSEDSHKSDYESTIVLMSYLQKEKFSNAVKDGGVRKSNLESLRKKLSKENLQVTGFKSIYMGKNDIDTFKHKIGYFPVSEPQPFVAISISGFNAVQKVNSIVGTSDLSLARKLEPKSLNAKYGLIKGKVSLSPQNKHSAKKWINYFFGGRIYEEAIFHPEVIRHRPINYQIITKPLKKIVVLISSKIGNQKLPRLLKDISDKGYFIKDIHMITRNVLNDVLSSAGPELADQYMMLSDKRELECFKFICDTTQNTCNFIIDMVGPNPQFIQDFIFNNAFNDKSSSEINHLVEVFDDFESVEVFHKLFFEKSIKTPNPDFTKGKDMEYYMFMREFNTSKDMYEFSHNVEELVSNEGFEVVGFATIKQNRFHLVKESFNDCLKESIRVSSYAKKRQDFQRFVNKCSEYLNDSNLLVCVFRNQNLIRNIHEISKSSVFADSNFYIPETVINTYGQSDNKSIVNSDILEKFFVQVGLDTLTDICQHLHISLGDDRTIKSSFVYDLPPQIDGIQQDDNVSTLLMMSQSLVQSASLSYAVKFFEKKGFSIKNISLNMVPDQFTHSIQQNLKSQDIYNENQWGNLREKLETEAFWFFIISKYNAIYECKALVNEFLKKISVFDGTLIDKEFNENDLQYKYGLYCSRSFEDSEKDLTNAALLIQTGNSFMTQPGPSDEVQTKLLQTDQNQGSHELGFILFRNKSIIKEGTLFEMIEGLNQVGIKPINFKFLDQLSEEDKNLMASMFKFKHDQHQLDVFLDTKAANYLLIPFEYKLGTNLKDSLGSFRMKPQGEKAIFSRGNLLQRYGCEFLHGQGIQECEKIVTRHFSNVDSRFFKLH